MDFGKILGTVAPTIGTLIGGPLGGMAMTAIADALGIDPDDTKKVQDAINSGKLTADQIVALKKADQDMEIKLKELGIQADKLEFDDRQNAREREVKLAGSWTTTGLAWLVVTAFVGIVYCVLVGGSKVEGALAGTLIGYMSAKAEQIIAYYFGSSRGSDDKTKALADIARMP